MPLLFPLLIETIRLGLCESSPLPHKRNIFLAAGVAIPPYSGTTKTKPSELENLFDIFSQVFPHTPFPFFFSGDHNGSGDIPKSKKNISRFGFNFLKI